MTCLFFPCLWHPVLIDLLTLLNIPPSLCDGGVIESQDYLFSRGSQTASRCPVQEKRNTRRCGGAPPAGMFSSPKTTLAAPNKWCFSPQRRRGNMLPSPRTLVPVSHPLTGVNNSPPTATAAVSY